VITISLSSCNFFNSIEVEMDVITDLANLCKIRKKQIAEWIITKRKENNVTSCQFEISIIYVL